MKLARLTSSPSWICRLIPAVGQRLCLFSTGWTEIFSYLIGLEDVAAYDDLGAIGSVRLDVFQSLKRRGPEAEPPPIPSACRWFFRRKSQQSGASFRLLSFVREIEQGESCSPRCRRRRPGRHRPGRSGNSCSWRRSGHISVPFSWPFHVLDYGAGAVARNRRNFAIGMIKTLSGLRIFRRSHQTSVNQLVRMGR